MRGVGLMIGIELAGAGVARAVQAACLEREMIVLTCGTTDSVLRLVPPLTVSEAELTEGLAVLDDAMAVVAGRSVPGAG